MTKLDFTNLVLMQMTNYRYVGSFEKENTDELGQSTGTFANHVYMFRLLCILFGHN